jgi:hypothetical protein
MAGSSADPANGPIVVSTEALTEMSSAVGDLTRVMVDLTGLLAAAMNDAAATNDPAFLAAVQRFEWKRQQSMLSTAAGITRVSWALKAGAIQFQAADSSGAAALGGLNGAG